MEGAVTVAQHQDLLPGDVAEPHQAGAHLSLNPVSRHLGSSPVSGETELEKLFKNTKQHLSSIRGLFMLLYTIYTN